MLAAIVIALAASAQNAPITVAGGLVHPRNLMVQYTDESSLDSLRKMGTIVRVIPQIRYAVLETKPGRLISSHDSLGSYPGIEKVDYDHCAKPAYDPNDQYWPQQWDMRAIKANLAWDSQKGNPNVIVAVIDTGVKVNHPDLAANIWVNSGEVPGNGIDDDADGYIDDVNGYDFAYGDGSPNDNYGHGTACAGLVAAPQDNTIGVSGVAPGCRIMALKAAIDSGYFYDSANVPAYIYAADHGAKVLSMSFYSDRVSQSERDAIEYCWNHGVLPVAAAANDATIYPYYPAAYEHVLSVAAVDGNLNKAGFSDYGSWVDVSAPGTGLYTTTNDNGYTSGFGGTSGACPHVAGVAALCFSANLAATNQQVREAIEDTATLQNQAPFGEFSNYGLVNADMAVARMNGGGVTSHPPVVRYVTRYVQNSSRTGPKILTRVYGRGFGGASTVELTSSGGLPIAIPRRDRDWFDFNAIAAPGGFSVKVDGSPVATITFPSTGSTSYQLAEASTQGATLVGGYAEAANIDSTYIRTTRRSDGSILVQGTFRLVSPLLSRLVLNRQYTGTTVGTETVQLYDWSSASYPYGNWVTLGTNPCPTTMTSTSFTITNPSRFIDPEGTVYLLITTSTDLPSGAEMRMDHIRLDQ
jgi:subtilisin family serine protease